jgi:hypothetical protein
MEDILPTLHEAVRGRIEAEQPMAIPAERM